MIFGRGKILFTKLNFVNSVKSVCLNQTWLTSNALQCRVLPPASTTLKSLNTHTEVKAQESLETNENKKPSLGENLLLLESDIQSQESVEGLLKMIAKQNVDSLTPSKIILILNHLQELKSQNKSIMAKKTLMSNPTFLKLFLVLENQIHEIENKDLFNLFSFCKKFGLPDKIMDACKIVVEIDKKKDKLSFRQKVMLYNLYSSDICTIEIPNDKKSELEFSILSDAKEKLKSYFIEDKLDVLYHAVMFPMPDEMKIEILKITLDLGRENWCQYDVAYWFLNFLNFVHKDFPDFEDIQKRLLDILQECINDNRFILTVPKFFKLLVNMVTFKKLEYRIQLFNCILDNVVKNDLPLEDKIIICESLNTMKFVHSAFLENLVETIIKDSVFLNEVYLHSVNKAVMNSACRYFGKKEWEWLFTSHKDLINWDSEKKLFAHAVVGAGSGLFCNEVFKRLSKKFTKEEILWKRNHSCLTILLMNHSIAAWNPTYGEPFLPKEIFLLVRDRAQKNLVHHYLVWSETIKNLIESAVGIKDCVLTCCWSKYGEVIDEVMALNENGEPLCLADVKKSNEIIYIEDIRLPPGYKLVLILNFQHFIMNSSYLRGRDFWKLNLVKELGHPVFFAVFDSKAGKNLSDSEKALVIWKQIKDKYISIDKKSGNTAAVDEPILLPLSTHSTFLHDPPEKKIDIVISDEKSWPERILTAIDGHVWYTDGSKKLSGLGSGIYYPERELEISNPLDFDGSSFEAEVDAIILCAQEAITTIENKALDSSKTVVNILTDSVTAISHISDREVLTTSERIIKCRKILKKLSKKARVRIIWIPGHSGIKGNEKADSLAKLGASGIQQFSEKIIDGER